MTVQNTVPSARPFQDEAEVLQRTAESLDLLRENAAHTDEEGRLPEENITRLHELGLLSLLQPTEYGGAQLDLQTTTKVQVAMATACASTSWVAGLSNVGSYLLALFPRRAQDEVWGADPTARTTATLSPAGAKKPEVLNDGSWKISGAWRYASGSSYSSWAAVAVPVDGEDGAEAWFALVPMSELTIQRSWDVAGMRGTESNTLIAEDVIVPPHRRVSYAAAMSGYGDRPHPDGLYRTPFGPIFGLSIAATPVGLAKAALELARETAPVRQIPYEGIVQADAPTVQTLLGNAAVLVDSAEMHLMRSARDADEAAQAGVVLDEFLQARSLADQVAATRYATEAIRKIIRAQLSGSFADTNPMQRMWRDCETAASHYAFAELHIEKYGKTLLGRASGS